MPMVGIDTFLVISAARSRGTPSTTTHTRRPARRRGRPPSSRSRPPASKPLVRPCTLWPPMRWKLCGVRPMWPTTGMSTRVRAWIVSAITTPPSSFTHSAPSFISRIELSTACCGLTWYEPNGRSPTISARGLARDTRRTWYDHVVECRPGWCWPRPAPPCRRESPTRIMSTPARSTRRAKVTS